MLLLCVAVASSRELNEAAANVSASQSPSQLRFDGQEPDDAGDDAPARSGFGFSSQDPQAALRKVLPAESVFVEAQAITLLR